MLSVELIDGFNEYTPFETKLTDELYWMLGPIVQKAKPFVRNRSTEELRQILTMASSFLQSAPYKAIPIISTLVDTHYSKEGYMHSQCAELYLCMDQYDVSALAGDTPWCELFATLALSYVGLLYSASKYPKLSIEQVLQKYNADIDKDNKILKDNIQNNDMLKDPLSNNSLRRGMAATFIQLHDELKQLGALSAMEAVSYASVLQLEEIKENNHKKRTTNTNKTRNEKTAPVKRWVYAEYQSMYDKYKAAGKKLSNAYAAEKIYSAMSSSKTESFDFIPSHGTLENWISDFRNHKTKNNSVLSPFKP